MVVALFCFVPGVFGSGRAAVARELKGFASNKNKLREGEIETERSVDWEATAALLQQQLEALRNENHKLTVQQVFRLHMRQIWNVSFWFDV